MNYNGMLVSDFDGTITRFDFYDLVCREFPDIAGEYWQGYESGRLTHFEALRLIFAGIRASGDKISQIIAAMQIDPSLRASIGRLRAAGWDVTVASAGCAWYIRRLLDASGVDLVLHANPGTFHPDRGLLMRLPDPSPFFSAELGVNKAAVVREALRNFPRVAFAGDGRPDLAAALLVPAHRRFAKSWLAKKLQEVGEGYVPFEVWSDVAAQLAGETEMGL